MLLENYIMDTEVRVGDENLKDYHDDQDGTEKENNERSSLIEGPIMWLGRNLVQGNSWESTWMTPDKTSSHSEEGA